MRRLSDIIFNQQPLMLPPSASVQDACTQMRNRSVGSVVVTGPHDQLLGIFTGRDAVSRVLAEGRDASVTLLDSVMTSNPMTLPVESTAIEALRVMWENGCRHLPVLVSERVVGVVSRGDFSGVETDRLDEERSLWEHIR